MDTDLKPSFLLPPSAEVAAEEAAAAGVELTAVEFFPVVVILGMMVGASAWLRPSVEAQSHQHKSLLYRAVTWPTRQLIHGVTVIEARVMHAMSKWLAPKVGMVAHALNSVTHEVHVLTQVLADTADNTHEALTWLRHQVVPELIADALKPIRARITAVENAVQTEVKKLTATVTHLERVVIPALETAVQTVVKTVTELQQVVIPALELGIATLTKTVTETIPQELTAIRDRIGKLEDYIVSAAFIAIIVAAVEKSFRFLTCRNMKSFGNDACAFDQGWMDSLLGLMFAGVILSDLRTLTHIAQEIEGEVVSLVDDALKV